MGFTTATDAARSQQIAEWQASTRRALDAIYIQHPGLARNTANDRLIVEMICRFLGVETSDCPMIAPGDFTLAMRANYEEFTKNLVWVKSEEQKTDLINEVLDLLRSPDGTGRGGKFSDFDLKNERTKLSYQTVEQIIKRRDEILLKQSLQTHSAQEIREAIQELRAEQAPSNALPVEMTAHMLKRDVSLLKKWIRIKGVDAVNDRLMGRN
jgi:hypothetical protein